MTATDRELVAAIRSELVAVEPSRPCDRAAELEGLGSATHRDPTLARLDVRLGRSRSRPDRAPLAGDGWDGAADHCRIAWLRGRFLVGGSLSVANGRTHLEFVVAPDEAAVLGRRLAAMGLPAGVRIRRGRGIVTWKSAETVGRFLRMAGSSAALLELEARSVARSLRGDLNRVVNAEAANVSRSVTAAGRQLAAIAELEAVGRLATQPRPVAMVARARRDAPEATISDLAETTGLHRSAVQRALDRLTSEAGLDRVGA